MKIPYGISSFKTIVTQGFLYIDKTGYIEKLERQGNYSILLRPRRFGKTLFLSSLWHYYDILFKDEFDTLFGDLHIGVNPTPLRNSYQVLLLDFSGIAVESEQSLRRDFTDKVETGLLTFLERYGYGVDAMREVRERQSPQGKADAFFRLCREAKIFLLIDEYDHFANGILGKSLERFREIMGKGGFVRSFYENIKLAASRGIVDRLFITGVTSITLDSLTSGFNISENISFHRDFNGAIGFTRQETETILQPLIKICDLDINGMMDEMAKWYNGYLFNAHAGERIFNSGMVLYFVRNFDQTDCRYPDKMLDPNIASDYGNIMRLFRIGDQEQNFAALEQLIADGEVTGAHRDQLDLEKGFNQTDFISLLLYMGFVTIGDAVLSEIRYCIPNYVIRKLYYEYFKVEIEQRA